MATRALLVDIADDWGHFRGPVVFEAMGGVDAVRRLREGSAHDLVVLAAEAIDGLARDGFVVAGSRIALVRSPVAIAARAGAPRRAIDDESSLREAMRAAHAIGLSTGPSGVAIERLLARWGLAGPGGPRVVQAAPGVPVARLLADDAVDLGFQQLSELAGQPGIDVLGTMPPGLEILTTFSGAVCASSSRAEAAAELLRFIRSPVVDAAKWRHGLQPIREETP